MSLGNEEQVLWEGITAANQAIDREVHTRVPVDLYVPAGELATLGQFDSAVEASNNRGLLTPDQLNLMMGLRETISEQPDAVQRNVLSSFAMYARPPRHHGRRPETYVTAALPTSGEEANK